MKGIIATPSSFSSRTELVFGGTRDGPIRILKGHNRRTNIRMTKRKDIYTHRVELALGDARAATPRSRVHLQWNGKGEECDVGQ